MDDTESGHGYDASSIADKAIMEAKRAEFFAGQRMVFLGLAGAVLFWWILLGTWVIQVKHQSSALWIVAGLALAGLGGAIAGALFILKRMERMRQMSDEEFAKRIGWDPSSSPGSGNS